ncbi:MAG: DNA polymerase III subunit chi [Alphaproteobacteria bacterium]
MSEVRFYHLQTRTQDDVLPSLLLKAYEAGKRIVVKLGDEREVAALDQHLWTFHPASFLPHGSAKTTKDACIALQPVWLTHKDENPNDADVLVIGHGAHSDMHADFSLCCEIFDGHDPDAVVRARENWKIYKEKGFDVTYWRQNEQGRWDKA